MILECSIFTTLLINLNKYSIKFNRINQLNTYTVELAEKLEN